MAETLETKTPETQTTETKESKKGKRIPEQIESTLKEIKNTITNFFNEILVFLNLKKTKEIQSTASETTQALNELKDTVTQAGKTEIENENIIQDEENILDKLSSQDTRIKGLFDRFNDESFGDDDENIKKVKIDLLKSLLTESTDDGKLEEEEIKEIGNKCEKLYNLLKSTLEDNDIQSLNPNATKKEILDAYSKISQQESNKSETTKEKIIQEIKNTRSTKSNEPTGQGGQKSDNPTQTESTEK